MNRPRSELPRIVASMTVTCAIGAAVLGFVYMGTSRYREAAELEREQTAIAELLGLGPDAALTEVRQFLAPAKRQVVYRVARFGAEQGAARELAFTLDGEPAGARTLPAAAAAEEEDGALVPLGRVFVASRGGRPAGFVAEGEVRGYKNVIRMFIALEPDFDVAGVRVVEHEEDPGLGAEVATPWFQGQFVGRTADEIVALGVTKDPMPEDWRVTLLALARRAPDGPARHAGLLARERRRPIYAVTGATISSQAVTDGVRLTVDHFRRRWALLEPHLGGLP